MAIDYQLTQDNKEKWRIRKWPIAINVKRFLLMALPVTKQVAQTLTRAGTRTLKSGLNSASALNVVAR
jgi:hypothetical protein